MKRHYFDRLAQNGGGGGVYIDYYYSKQLNQTEIVESGIELK